MSVNQGVDGVSLVNSPGERRGKQAWGEVFAGQFCRDTLSGREGPYAICRGYQALIYFMSRDSFENGGNPVESPKKARSLQCRLAKPPVIVRGAEVADGPPSSILT